MIDAVGPAVTCPLCGSRDPVLAGRYAAKTLAHLYKDLGVGVDLPVRFVHYYDCSDCHLGFFSPLCSGDESFYQSLQRHDWYYLGDKPEYRIAAKYLPADGKVLEIGAGKGAFARVCGRDRYTGLELSAAAVASAKSADIPLRHETIEAHAESFPAAYRAVVAFQVLEHVSDPRLFIESAVRCLAPGGRLILAVPSQDSFVGKAMNNVLNAPPHHLTRWRDRTLAKITELFALSPIAIEHEALAEIHSRWASGVLWRARLWELFGVSYSLFDTRILARAGIALASLLGRLFPRAPEDGYGHTVIGVYQVHAAATGRIRAPRRMSAVNADPP